MQEELQQKIIHRHKVRPEDFAHFKDEKVHHVCSTFALAREIEWTTRKFVHLIKDENQEGIGTMLEIEHKAPAFEGEVIVVMASVDSFENGELICSYEVRVGERLIAQGRTGQKILPKAILDKKLNYK